MQLLCALCQRLCFWEVSRGGSKVLQWSHMLSHSLRQHPPLGFCLETPGIGLRYWDACYSYQDFTPPSRPVAALLGVWTLTDSMIVGEVPVVYAPSLRVSFWVRRRRRGGWGLMQTCHPNIIL